MSGGAAVGEGAKPTERSLDYAILTLQGASSTYREIGSGKPGVACHWGAMVLLGMQTEATSDQP